MSKPTYQQVHVDTPMTNVAIVYRNTKYIGDTLFPNVQVQKISDKYFVYTKADWFRREAGPRAPGTRAPRGDYGLSLAQYTCIEMDSAKGVPDEIVNNADDPLNPLRDAAEWCTDQVQLQKESDVAAIAFGTGWSSSATPSVVWSNDTSTPLTDVETAMNSIVGGIGAEANTGVLGRGLWRYIKNHPDIVDRIKYSAGPNSPAVVTLQAVAALFGLDRLLVGVAIEDTGKEGGTSTMSYVWGSHMLVAYVTPRPSIQQPSAGYVFTYLQRRAERFREDQEHQIVIAVSESYDVVAVASDAGYLIKSAA